MLKVPKYESPICNEHEKSLYSIPESFETGARNGLQVSSKSKKESNNRKTMLLSHNTKPRGWKPTCDDSRTLAWPALARVGPLNHKIYPLLTLTHTQSRTPAKKLAPRNSHKSTRCKQLCPSLVFGILSPPGNTWTRFVDSITTQHTKKFLVFIIKNSALLVARPLIKQPTAFYPPKQVASTPRKSICRRTREREARTGVEERTRTSMFFYF